MSLYSYHFKYLLKFFKYIINNEEYFVQRLTTCLKYNTQESKQF